MAKLLLTDIRKCGIYERGDKLYIDARTKYGRVRISSGLSANEANKEELQKNIFQIVLSYFNKNKSDETFAFDFIALGQKFLENLKSLKQSSLAGYKSKINRLNKYFGRKDVRLLDESDYEAFLETQKNAKNYIKIINRMLKDAKERESSIKLLSAKKFAYLNTEPKEILPFSLEESKALIKTAKNIEIRNYLTLAIFSGMRVGEILALKKENIDFEFDKIQVAKTKGAFGETSPKTKTSNRFIDMLPIVKEALLNQVEISKDTPYLFNLSRKYIRKEYDELLQKLGLKKRVLYNTRHSFASIMLSQGEEPLWVSAMLGHKNLNITYECYAKYIPLRKQRASFIDFNLEEE